MLSIGFVNKRFKKYLSAALFLLLILFSDFSIIHAQCINPWNLKFEHLKAGDISVNPGIYNGYDAEYGFISHINAKDPFVGLPFIFIPAKDSISKKIIVVLNGGPGKSNLNLPFVNDTLISRFSILIPGYRGVDDSLGKISYINLWDQNIIDATATDIIKIVRHYAPDTLVMVSHSFGSVFAKKIIENIQNKTFTIPIYVSPMVTNDVAVIATSLQNMIQRGLSHGELNQSAFHLFVTLPDFSPLDAIGLVFLFGKYDNIVNLYSGSITVKELQDLTQNEYRRNESQIKTWHRNRCLAEFLRTDNLLQEPTGRLAYLLQEYFKGFVTGSKNTAFNIFFTSNEVVIEAEYDYFHVPESIVIKSTGHSDVWGITWQLLPSLIREKIEINF